MRYLLLSTCFFLLLACLKQDYALAPAEPDLRMQIPDTFLTRFYALPEFDTLSVNGYYRSEKRLVLDYVELEYDLYPGFPFTVAQKAKLKSIGQNIVGQVFDPTIVVDSAVFKDNTLLLNVYDNFSSNTRSNKIEWRLQELLP